MTETELHKAVIICQGQGRPNSAVAIALLHKLPDCEFKSVCLWHLFSSLCILTSSRYNQRNSTKQLHSTDHRGIRLRGLTGRVLDHRSFPPEFESWHEHI